MKMSRSQGNDFLQIDVVTIANPVGVTIGGTIMIGLGKRPRETIGGPWFYKGNKWDASMQLFNYPQSMNVLQTSFRNTDNQMSWKLPESILLQVPVSAATPKVRNDDAEPASEPRFPSGKQI